MSCLSIGLVIAGHKREAGHSPGLKPLAKMEIFVPSLMCS